MAISAKMHTGKTTLAESLVGPLGLVRASFAASMKDLVTALRLPQTRLTYQKMGHYGRELVDESIWIKAFMNRYEENPRLVVDDMRYENEYQFLLHNNAYMIRLTCDEETRWERYKTSDKYVPGTNRKSWTARLNHPTETQLDHPMYHWDLEIDTSRLTSEQVFEKVLDFVVSKEGLV